jgi:hypothetical protein
VEGISLIKIPTAHFGTAAKDAVDWRKETDEDPDDTELAVTPPDVVKMLGFDPAKEKMKNPLLPMWIKPLRA